jgi:hypothetical protein
MDKVISAVTGKARNKYTREAAYYLAGAARAVPTGMKNAYNVMAGKQGIEMLDLSDKVPTNWFILKYAKAIPRLLEATDIFYRTIIKQGEESAIGFRNVKSGRARELTESQLKEADDISRYYVFRKEIDTTNASGQGNLLSSVDRVTESLMDVTKNIPLLRLVVPFIQTPMNILKQGIEFTPLGLFTTLGAKDKTRQIAKATVGSMILGTIYTEFALKDRLTFAAPRNKTERDAFYEAGKLPYSVKIGDKWVQFSRLGPVGYPMAMAAAIDYNFRKNPKAYSDTDKTVATLKGIGQFFAEQSYMEGLNSLLENLQYDNVSSIGKTAGSFAGQYVPMSSFLRWLTSFTDDYNRAVSSESTHKAFMEQIMRGIPGLSDNLSPRTDIYGNPQEKNMAELSAVLPVSVAEADRKGDDLYDTILGTQKFMAESVKTKDQLKQEAVPIAQQLRSVARSDPEYAQEQLDILTERNPDLAEEVESFITKYQKDPVSRRISSTTNIKDGTRAMYLYSEYFPSLKNDVERARAFEQLRKDKVISDAVLEQLQELYGL